MRTHRFRTIAAGACASALLTVAACGGGDDEAGGGTTTADPSASSTDAPSTTLDPAAQAEADVRAAYDAYWAMSERLAAAPDPQDPEIGERTTGTAETTLVEQLMTLSAQAIAVVFGADYSHDVLAVDVDLTAGRAVVDDCYVDHSAEIDARTGEQRREATFTNRFKTTLELEDESWKVGQIERLGRWEGVTACE